MQPLTRAPLRRVIPWRLATALMACVLSACQAPDQALRDLAGHQGYQLRPLAAGPFVLMLGVPEHSPHSSRLRLYIEGDGRAWATPTQPSLDPTPHTLLIAAVAMGDPAPGIYLARPCQFIRSRGCEVALWTDRRFASEVVDSLDHAISTLKSRYGNRDFELVGYSGGAALALLLAARRDDVAQVQTVAGNLSPRRWAQELHLAPLDGSLEPLDYAERLARIPQRHWLAADDRVVPPALAVAYREALGPNACVELRTIAGAGHDHGWVEAWVQGRDTPIDCNR